MTFSSSIKKRDISSFSSFYKCQMKMILLLSLIALTFHVSLCIDLTYYVEEGKSPGTYVGDIAADSHLMNTISPQDKNLIRFSQIKKDMVSTAQLFQVSKKTGKLYTAQMLDAESICRRNAECFKTVDVAVRKRESFIKILEIKVIVKDINDYKPEFPSPQVRIEFSEDDRKGAKRSIPNAIDRDVGDVNSQVNYHLKKDVYDPFTLSVLKSVARSSKLSIVLEDVLDREAKDSYVMQVIAEDSGYPPKRSVLDIYISIGDVNDNVPHFIQNVYNVTLDNEHDVLTPIVILSATDLDKDQNGEIRYHFSSQTSDVAKLLFKLNEKTGEIFLYKPFMAGQQLTYYLYIEATDHGNPPLSSAVKVIVNVISQQNNAPVIDINFVSDSTGNVASISEDIEVGSFIAYVKVTDPDAAQNGEVRCELYHDKFQLQSLGIKKYKVIVKTSLDREVRSRHDVSIACQDKGSPPLLSETKFSVNVMDVNDERPEFSKRTFKFWVPENHESKYKVGYINVTDLDLGLGGQLSYSLVTNKKHFLPFHITDNGLILTLVSLDHEFQDVYRFKVFVKDKGVPSQNNTANVVVTVKDENDNAPYFTFPSVNPYTLKLLHYLHDSKNITTLRASDRDSRENAFLKYEILHGNENQLFTLDRYKGLLSFSRDITLDDGGIYNLEFIVKDNGTPMLNRTTKIAIVLTVSDKIYEDADEQKDDDKVHMFVMIVIVLVSMTVSVPITAVIAICFVRCRNQKTQAANACKKHVSEHKHLMCTSNLDSSFADAPTDRMTDSDVVRISEQAKSRQGIYPGDQLDKGQSGSTSRTRLQKDKDIIYQEIDGEEREQRRLMIANCPNNLISSDSDDGWPDGDAGKTKKQGKRLSSCCKAHSSCMDQQKKSLHKQFLSRRNKKTIARCSNPSNIGHIPDCTQWIDLRSSTGENELNESQMESQLQHMQSKCV